jgi:hypothetical protein
MASNVVLSPIQELAPGQVAAIRNQVIRATVAKASKELSLPANKLVVRDIRALSDLDFGNNTDYMATVNTDNIWGSYEATGTYVQVAGSGSHLDAISDNKTMADQRYIAIYGVRDLRLARVSAAETERCVSLIRFDIGNAHRAIWDVSKCEGYMDGVAGITSSAVIIPPLAAYQISPYVSVASKEPSIQLMGVVVEPAGLLISPLTRNEDRDEAIQTQLIPVRELAPGEIGHIRNAAKQTVLEMAMSELNLPSEKLVIRDIRPYTDLMWCTHITSGVGSATQVVAASTIDSWYNSSGTATLAIDSTAGYPASATDFHDVVIATSTTMADSRFVGIYGVRDGRMSLATKTESAVTNMKITTGGNDRAIWDLQVKDAYPNQMAAVCPSVVVIPQNTEYQFGFHNGYTDSASGTDLQLLISLMGFVVEPVGKTLSP